MTASIVVLTHRRLETIAQVLAAWQKESQDVWLCDCSAKGVRDAPLGVKHVRFLPDPGSRTRHAVALLTAGDVVIKADDDILPHPGLVADFCRNMEALGPSILGMHGRTFHGPDYYANTRLYCGKHLAKPLKVDFCGVITCSPRRFLAMDLRACATEVEDLYWQMQAYPQVPKYVIPTDKFSNLPSCKDPQRLCGNPEARKIRRAYFSRWYERNYRHR